MCKWTFARKDTTDYFIKQFLFPTYPVKGAPGSPKTIEAKHRQCKIFETHHEGIMKALAGKSSVGGNLIVTRDFFRWEAKYYKITHKVDVASLAVTNIAKLPLEKRVIILRTITHSLRILHQSGIVHGDLKPDNILIKETSTSDYTTKLIDFDNSYFSGKPPAILEEVVGDMVYYSPELSLYVQGDKSISSSDLQLKSDIFALGLIYCQYLTGDLPVFDKKKYRYSYVAVLNGKNLNVDKTLPPELRSLLESMLLADFKKRPDVNEVFAKLKSKDLLDATSKPSVETSTSLATSVGLRGTLLKSKPEPVKLKPSTPDTSSGLKGSLIKKSKK